MHANDDRLRSRLANDADRTANDAYSCHAPLPPFIESLQPDVYRGQAKLLTHPRMKPSLFFRLEPGSHNAEMQSARIAFTSFGNRGLRITSRLQSKLGYSLRSAPESVSSLVLSDSDPIRS